MLASSTFYIWTEQSPAQTSFEIINVAISDVTHDLSGGHAYLVMKTDARSKANLLTVDYDISPLFDSPELRTVRNRGHTGEDGYRMYEVLLDELPASSTIYYRVKDADGSVRISSSFRTAQPEGEPFTFGVYADLHSGDGVSGHPDTRGSSKWSDTVQRMAGEDLDIALSGGDSIAVTGWRPAPYGWGYFEDLVQIKQKYNTLFSGSEERPYGTRSLTDSVPVYTATGNHEEIAYPVAKTAYEQEMLLPENSGTEAATYGEEYYSFDRGDTHFICLSTEIPDLNYPLEPGPGGQLDSDCCKISGAQRDWLEADLAATNKKWKVVFMHRLMYVGLAPEGHAYAGQEAIAWGNCSTYIESDPPDPGSCVTKARINRDETHDLFIQYGVDVVFQGHAHHYSRHIRDGISYVTTGGAGSHGSGIIWAYPGDVAINAYEHVKVEETPDTLMVEAVETDSGSALDIFIPANGTLTIAGSDGGDCSTIGTWDAGANTCTLTSDVVVGKAPGIAIAAAGITLDGDGHRLIGGGNHSGVTVAGVSGVSVEGLAVEGFHAGISLVDSSNIDISLSNLTANEYGIRLERTTGSNIYGNTVAANLISGITLSQASQNTISGNTISDNLVFGLHIEGETSVDNLVFQNNFENNVTQAQVDAGSGNQFHETLPTGGNYWNDWITPDVDGNGIVDNPYLFSGGSDLFPWATSRWDITAPNVDDIKPAGAVNAVSAVSATYSDSGSGIDTASVEVSLDGAVMAGCTVDSVSVSCPANGLAEGAHDVLVSVSDNAGNTAEGLGSFTFDQGSPTVVNVQPSGTISGADPVISADYADSVSGIDTGSVEVRLDGAVMTGCTVGAASVSCPAGSLEYGGHSIAVSVDDAAGNHVTGTGSFTLVDATPPVVTDIWPSGAIAFVPGQLSAQFHDPGLGVIDTESVTVTLDGFPLACDVSISTAICTPPAMSEGTYVVTVSVADVAGNTTLEEGSFTIDLTAPVVTGIQPDGTITDSEPVISTGYDDAETGIDAGSVIVSLDGFPLECAVTTASATCAPGGPLSEGLHVIGVTIDDLAGNTTSEFGSFTLIDAVPPSISNIEPAGTITDPDPVVSADYTDTLSGVDTASVVVRLDGSVMTGCTVGAASVSCPADGLADGVHDIAVSVSDYAGNGASGTGQFVLQAPSCARTFTDAIGTRIEIFSDASFTDPLCQQQVLSADTTYYLQVRHDSLDLSSERAVNNNYLRVHDMRGIQVVLGDGAPSATFNQLGTGPPYVYRTSFRTPVAPEVYSLEIEISGKGSKEKVEIRGWNAVVGSTQSYVRTYSDSSYSIESETFAPGSSVYIELYSPLLADGMPVDAKSTAVLGDFSGSTTDLPIVSIRVAPGTYRSWFTLPDTPGDRALKLRIMESPNSALAIPEILLQVPQTP